MYTRGNACQHARHRFKPETTHLVLKVRKDGRYTSVSVMYLERRGERLIEQSITCGFRMNRFGPIHQRLCCTRQVMTKWTPTSIRV